ncbi:MAG TPA: ATP-binding protein [Herpetosiphonaceae bacterium]|nr:ATP-binding protein [Herpetosiphonaceae bacterium]
MLEATDYRLRQRDYLLHIGQAMTAQLDLDAVLSLVIEYAVEIVAGTYGLIALQEPPGNRMRVVASYNLPEASWSAFDPLLEVLFTPSSTPDLESRIARSVADTLSLPLRQVVSLPLLVANTPMGVIVVFRAALNVAFTPDDRRMLQSFADQAAIAVQNAQLYQSVVRERERLNAIIEQSADGVMIFDERWRITTFNRAMERLTGWPRDEAIGRPCAEVIGYHNPQGFNLCLVDCPLQRRPYAEHPVAEGWVTTRDGRKRYLQSRYSPSRGPRGEFLGAIANVRDITARKQEEEQQLTFVSVISHELKTPVAIIKGYAGTLRRPDATWDQATIAEGLAIIEEEADRLNELIANLLDVSRLQAGSLTLTIAPFSLPSLVERVVQGIAATAGDKFEFQLRFPNNFPRVLADESRIQMVLSNLLTNAVKYSPEGGVVRIGGWVEDSEVLVYVSDQGIGIAPEDRERIFDRFYRADNSLSRATQGAGLGLYLAKVIIEAHGGRIYAESQPGGGTRFVFTLPVDRPQLRDAGPVEAGDDVVLNAEHRPVPDGETSMRLKDILPADVIEANIDHLNTLFVQGGYHPDVADLPNAEVTPELAEAIRADPGLLRYTEEHGRTQDTGTGL